MSVQFRRKGPIAIAQMGGALTLGKACDELRRGFREALEEGDRRFIFDMLEVPFVDSSGVGEVIACHKRVSERDGVIKLVLKGKSHELFVFWELNRLFKIFDDLESALASFADVS